MSIDEVRLMDILAGNPAAGNRQAIVDVRGVSVVVHRGDCCQFIDDGGFLILYVPGALTEDQAEQVARLYSAGIHRGEHEAQAKFREALGAP